MPAAYGTTVIGVASSTLVREAGRSTAPISH